MTPSGQEPAAYETTGDMAVAARPRANSYPRTFVHSRPVSLRQLSGSMSLLPFPGSDAMPQHCLPEFPDYPSEHMPRSQTPVVSHPLAMTRPAPSPSLCFGHRLSAIALRFGYRPGG